MSTVPPTPGPPGPPWQQWARLALQPATALHVDVDDRVYVAHRASAVGAMLLYARFQRPEDGVIVPQLFRFATVADRSQQFTAFQIGEGTLLGLSLHCSDAALHEASVYAEVGIVRGGDAEAQRMQALASGYLDRLDALAWPGGRSERASDAAGRIRSLTGTDPAPGTEVLETVPAGASWILHALHVAFTTGGAVANRRVHVLISGGGSPILEAVAQDVQAAALLRNYNVGAWGFAPPAQDSELYVAMPFPLPLEAGFTIETVTTNLQAADDFEAPQMLVEERLTL